MEKMRSALMVVASLIATMAFQASTNPPSFGKDAFQYRTASQAAGATSPNPPQISRLLVHPDPDPPYEYFSSEPPMTQFMLSSSRDYDYQYSLFFLCNSIGFTASLSIILLLISGLPLKRRLFTWILMVIIWVAVIAMAMAYLITREFFEESSDYYTYPWILLWIISLGAILLLGHMIRIAVKMIKYIRKLIRRLRKNQTQEAHEPSIVPAV